MAIGGSGLSALFWVEPITPGDVASWLTDGVLKDGGTGSGGGTTIGSTVFGGTPPAVLYIGPGGVLAQDPTNFYWNDSATNLDVGGGSPGGYRAYNFFSTSGGGTAGSPIGLLLSLTYAGAGTTNYERAVFDWTITPNVLTIGTQASGSGVTRNLQFIVGGVDKLDYGITASGWTFNTAYGSPPPKTLTGTSGTIDTTTSSWIINPSGTFTVTLPAAASNPGTWIFLKCVTNATVNSAASNVVPINSTTAGTAIIAGGASVFWANLQSDGTNWITMAIG